MRRFLAVLTCLATVLAGLAMTSGASAVQVAHNQVVRATPVNFTPNVLNGEVFAVAQVGNKIILGGSFTRVQNAGSTTTLTRNYLLAFDKSTGVVDTAFVPSVTGTVRTLVPASDGTSVYVGGQFSNINGVSGKILRLNTSTGAVNATFRPGAIDAVVYDAKLVGGRLFIAGQFNRVGTAVRGKLAELDPNTGAAKPSLDLPFAGTHNGGSTLIYKIGVAPDGQTLVAVGNFATVAGADRMQIAMIDLSASPAALADWQTDRFKPLCYSSFERYVNDVDFSPDGSYFAITTMGGYGSGPPSLCDSVSRWETSHRGSAVDPTWVNYTGGDSIYAVAVTGAAIYVGGHQRWTNNPFAADAAGPGAVVRTGIAALDPVNGLPLSWNPGRDRGRGVFDFLATADGLWVGSDTDRIAGGLYRARIAFFPLAGGSSVPRPSPVALPADVNMLGAPPATDRRYLYRVNAGGPTLPSSDGGPSWAGDSSDPSPYRNGGSNAADWGSATGGDSSVPSSTPLGVFATERWSPNDNPPLQWSFPVEAGKNLQVRLYFANRCGCTSGAGQRVFDVVLDGATVLDDYDIVADVGDQVGTMKAFNIVSDGTVNIDLTHVVENPLINAIEIIDRDAPAPDTSAQNVATRRTFDGSSAGGVSSLPASSIQWGLARGAFWLDGQVYTAWADGTMTVRSFNGSTFGAPQTLDLHGLGQFSAEMQSMTGLFYENGRIYFTQAGDNRLYSRYFTVESGIVGASRFVAANPGQGPDWSQVRGTFLSGQSLFWVSNVDGSMHRIDWENGAPESGTDVVVSGPAVDGIDWSARAIFSSPATGTANQPPVATFTHECDETACSFDGSDSEDPDGTISSYSWDFGDGETGTGATVPHSYTLPGRYEVTLTVTDNRGTTSSSTVTVKAGNLPPTASFTVECAQLTCDFVSTSADPDGSIVDYSWDFGDGSQGSGAEMEKTFSAADTYLVQLTVTDDRSTTSTTSKQVEVTSQAVSFVGAAAVNGNTNLRSRSVNVPGNVAAGDVLVLAASTNNASPVYTDPAGWTRVQLVTTPGMSSVFWVRTATASDAGTSVTVATDLYLRGSVVLTAYRGGAVSLPGEVLAAGETATTAAHTTPVVNVTSQGSWVVSYWADKSASTTAWSAPPGQVRSTGAGTGSGHISWLLSDSGGPVPVAPAGGLTATADSAARNAVMLTVVIHPTA